MPRAVPDCRQPSRCPRRSQTTASAVARAHELLTRSQPRGMVPEEGCRAPFRPAEPRLGSEASQRASERITMVFQELWIERRPRAACLLDSSPGSRARCGQREDTPTLVSRGCLDAGPASRARRANSSRSLPRLARAAGTSRISADQRKAQHNQRARRVTLRRSRRAQMITDLVLIGAAPADLP